MAGPLRVWIDFDGTLVVPNVAVVLVETFGRDGARLAREVDELLHRGEITLREAWEREVALLPADRVAEMAEYAREHAPLRAGARRLVELIERHRVPAAIVSGGLDFYIRPVLEREGIRWPVFADAMTVRTDGTLGVAHPFGHATCRLCGICKAEVVRSAPGSTTVFIGDGSTDRFAAEVADVVFARHRLVAYCRRRGIPCREFESLDTVAEWLEARLRPDEAPGPARRSLGLADSPCPISRSLVAPAAPTL